MPDNYFVTHEWVTYAFCTEESVLVGIDSSLPAVVQNDNMGDKRDIVLIFLVVILRRGVCAEESGLFMTNTLFLW